MGVVLSMEVAGAAEIGMVDDRVLGRGFAIGPVGDDGGDALVGERADGDGACRDDLARSGAMSLNRRRMPRQVRKPCSGWGRLARMAMTSPSALGPIEAPQRRKRSGVHS